MQRISAAFEARFVTVLRGLLTEAEAGEVDYELAATAYPSQQPDGSMGVSMGMSVSLATRALTLGDHVMVSGLIQDPYADDTLLATNARELLDGLRKRRAESGAIGNGQLIVPG